MNKAWLSFLLVFTVAFLGACGAEDEKAETMDQTESTDTSESTEETTEPAEDVAVALAEPTEEDICAYCNMTVYGEDDEMGAFTAQGVDHEGHNHFFDDVGCMLNYETKEDMDLEKYVRDLNTKEWLSYEDATIVKSDMKTPMNYGYGFFTEATDAEKFVEDNSADNAMLASEGDVAALSLERHKMKMEKMKNGEGGHDDKMKDGEMPTHDGDMKDEDSMNHDGAEK